MLSVRRILLLVVGLLLVAPAALAEVGTCYTSPSPMSDGVTGDCDADEPDCSTLPEVQPQSGSLPSGPRCLEAGPTCRPGAPALPVGADALPILLATPAVAPKWSPSLLPPLEPVSFVPVRCERAAPPPVPPPRA